MCFSDGPGNRLEGVAPRHEGDRSGLKRVFDVEDSLLALFFHGRKVEAILLREGLKDADGLEAPRDQKGQCIGKDDGHHDGVIAADFEDHEDRGEGDAQKSGEENTHADERVSADGAGEVGKEVFLEGADRATQHRSDEEGGREHAARGSAGERERGGEQLEENEGQKNLPDELAVECLIDDVVAGSHDLGEAEEADGSYENAGDGGLQEKRPAGKSAQARAQVAENEGKNGGEQAAEDSKDGIRHELPRVAHGDGGNPKQRLGSPEPAGDDDAGDGGEHKRAEDGGAPAADDFFNDEQNSGDGGVEGGGETSGCSDGGKHAQAAAGKVEIASDDRGDASADLERWIFRSQRVAAANGERGSEEFADDGAKRNVTVVDI